MTISVEATFENGVLKPAQPLPFAEHQKLTLTIQPAISRTQQSYGMLGWQGDPQIVREIAMDKDLEYDQ